MDDPAATFDDLRRLLTAAARERFAMIRTEDAAGERLYAYALYTSDDADGAVPAANTEEVVRRQSERLAAGGYPFEVGHLRYCPDQWAYGGARGCVDAWSRANAVQDALREASGLPFAEFKERTLEAMERALGDLDSEGFFGTGPGREAVTLLVWVTDSPLAQRWIARSVEALNPPSVVRRFREEWPKA